MNRSRIWLTAILVILIIALMITIIFFALPILKSRMAPSQEQARQDFARQGGLRMVLRVDVENLDVSARPQAVDRVLAIFRDRLDQVGVTNAVIEKSGNDRITVGLPGFADAKRAKWLIGETTQLQFKLLESSENAALILSEIDKVLTELKIMIMDPLAATPGEIAMAPSPDAMKQPFRSCLEPNPGTSEAMYVIETDLIPKIEATLSLPEVKEVIPGDVEFVFGSRPEFIEGRNMTGFYILRSPVQMSGRHLEKVQPEMDEYGAPIVDFKLTPEGRELFSSVTGANIGKRLAILLDGKVESAPVIQDRIRSYGRITLGAGASFEEARDLSIILNSGAFPAPVEVMEAAVVPPAAGVPRR
jgi:protein-export membrane protein SecD